MKKVPFLLLSAILTISIAGQTIAEEIHLPMTTEANDIAARLDQDLIERAYVWGWPMVYLHNMQKSLRLIHASGVSGGAPVAPINRLSMLTTPVSADFGSVPCPNPDLVYGFAMLDLSAAPVVLQVPQIDDRVWLFQVGDHRTDSIAQLGSMYQTQPGFYAIVGPNWQGELPSTLSGIVRSSTNLAYVIPRYQYQEGSAEALKTSLTRIAVYPLSKYDGAWKTRDWSNKKWYPQTGSSTKNKTRFVNPETYFDDLELVLEQVPPLPGEESSYEQMRKLIDEKKSNPKIASYLADRGSELEEKLMTPLYDFQNVGNRVDHQWTTVSNGASFGTDFQTRSAVAKSNIFVNRPNETKYFHVEQDHHGDPLSGEKPYRINIMQDQLPSHSGFWSLTVYDQDHRLVAHPSGIYSIGSHQELKKNEDGSITICLQNSRPESSTANWLPTPSGHFVVYLRVYCPSVAVIEGKWKPPAIQSQLSEMHRTRLTSTSPNGSTSFD